MNYTLWTRDTKLGRTTPFFLAVTPGKIMAFFHPADAWETAGAPLAAFTREMPTLCRDVAAAVPRDAFPELGEPERTRRMQNVLLENPSHRRLRELMAAVAALALELRDERGRVVGASGITIMHIPTDGESIRKTRFEPDAFGIELSDLILHASLADPAA